MSDHLSRSSRAHSFSTSNGSRSQPDFSSNLSRTRSHPQSSGDASPAQLSAETYENAIRKLRNEMGSIEEDGPVNDEHWRSRYKKSLAVQEALQAQLDCYRREIKDLRAEVQRLTKMTSQQDHPGSQSSTTDLHGANGRCDVHGSNGHDQEVEPPVWKGRSAGRKPSRVFSESISSGGPAAVGAVATKSSSERAASSSVNRTSKAVPKPSITAADAQKIDGVPFRESAIRTDENKPDIGSQKSAPQVNTGSVLTRTKPLSHSHVPVKPALNRDSYTTDAAHTPLAKLGHPLVDGADDHPIKEASPTRQPNQPSATDHGFQAQTRPRLPTERQESYFPVFSPETSSGIAESSSSEPDPALTGQLGLTNEVASDHAFLSQVDEKLATVTERLVPDPSPDQVSNGEDDAGEEQAKEQDDHNPGLRLRPGTNFGRPWGEA